MADVAHQRHGQVRQVLLDVLHCLEQCQGRQRVRMLAVAGIDDMQPRRRPGCRTMRRAAGRMAQHQDARRQACYGLGQRIADSLLAVGGLRAGLLPFLAQGGAHGAQRLGPGGQALLVARRQLGLQQGVRLVQGLAGGRRPAFR
ncbi:hypothetical protein G6F32_014696 [Rhizopus arrhizus]|nr:hypothetical protein G6F32_014696 [Rhizopus arrhizus]